MFEQRRVANDARLDDFRQATAQFHRRQRVQYVGIRDYQSRLLERAHQILALWQIHSSLAAHAGIDHRQQRGGYLDERHTAHVGSRGEASHIAHDAASDRHYRAAPFQSTFHEGFVEPGDGG